MIFDVDYALEILPILLSVTLVTIGATIGGMALALVVGLVLTVARMVPLRPVSLLAAGYVEFVRSTPLLVQLYFLFFVLPLYGITLNAFVAGLLGLGLHYSSYMSEVYRAGIESVPDGQWEAAVALNFSSVHMWRRVIIPEMIPPVLPAIGNYFIGMFKDTPLLASVGVIEILGAALQEAGFTYRYFEPLTLVGLIFLAISLPASAGLSLLERRVGGQRYARDR